MHEAKDIETGAQRLAIEIIATLVNVKHSMAELILKPAGVPPEIYGPLLYMRDEATGRLLSKRADRTTHYRPMFKSALMDLVERLNRQGEERLGVCARNYAPVDSAVTERWGTRVETELLKLGVRWFDPTQSFETSVPDKGLVEALMLKRAVCTVYMVQESDTLGKDSELAATLAQGKPVIAYVRQIDGDAGIQTFSWRVVVKTYRLLSEEAPHVLC